MSEWKTINSAPKDGTIIILCRTYEGRASEVRPGAWSPSETGDTEFPWLFWERLNKLQIKPNGWLEDAPTHWMPLPEPPNDPQ